MDHTDASGGYPNNGKDNNRRNADDNSLGGDSTSRSKKDI